ncbi:MAG: intradiol ring-cleavage dioxygenase [Parvularculaceae bacterium]
MKPHTAEEHDRGLHHDLKVLLHRRRALGLLASTGSAAILAACSDGAAPAASSGSTGSSAASTGTGSSSSGTSAGSCTAVPAETAGPYPADGSNTANGSLANVLVQSGVVRTDIRSSFGSQSGTAGGVTLVLTLTLVNVNASCAPLAGYAVYLWHCDANGQYSVYDLPGQNYLRGVAITDQNGQVSFTTVFPGCYAGRYPHMHFEVYPSLAAATVFSNRRLVSQLAMPENYCTLVYNSLAAYGSSISRFAQVSIGSDNVFADNSVAQISAQTPAMSGSPFTSLTGAATIGLAV